MRSALLTIFCCSVATALTGEEALEKWGEPRGGVDLPVYLDLSLDKLRLAASVSQICLVVILHLPLATENVAQQARTAAAALAPTSRTLLVAVERVGTLAQKVRVAAMEPAPTSRTIQITVELVETLAQKGFEAQAPYTVGSQPYGVAVGDFNRDGYLDIVAANIGDNTVSVLLGTGSGIFQPQATFPVGVNPYGVAVGDFNRDGYLDIVVTNGGGNSVSVLLGDGLGGLPAAGNIPRGVLSARCRTAGHIPVGFSPQGVAVGDFNEDGYLDIVAANSGGNSVSFLLGDGLGSFQPQATFVVGPAPQDVAVGDFNRDGYLDIVTTNIGDSTVSVLFGDGSGSFQPQSTFPVGPLPLGVAVGDFNRDGYLDIVTTSINGGTGRVSVLLGDGSGSFQPQATFPVGSFPYGVAVGDFNRDGFLDIAATNSGNLVSVLLGIPCSP
ncbi:hypothetical protein N7481_002928 [Penicillium waksmanii]|uniref:uncharacterized protein n=1 Tax=Penicillium waksmanii TaxID=69791 RepID=UPI002547C726|nr:uncharacterized protein N7481_002928 [Penicillium waksmanii]KAJ5987718.1 hypothetical protein N7481_002928 [Penicillium waksmanii]